MNSRLVVIPTRCAHSNHEQVARSIAIDIIANRYSERSRRQDASSVDPAMHDPAGCGDGENKK